MLLLLQWLLVSLAWAALVLAILWHMWNIVRRVEQACDKQLRLCWMQLNECDMQLHECQKRMNVFTAEFERTHREMDARDALLRDALERRHESGGKVNYNLMQQRVLALSESMRHEMDARDARNARLRDTDEQLMQKRILALSERCDIRWHIRPFDVCDYLEMPFILDFCQRTRRVNSVQQVQDRCGHVIALHGTDVFGNSNPFSDISRSTLGGQTLTQHLQIIPGSIRTIKEAWIFWCAATTIPYEYNGPRVTKCMNAIKFIQDEFDYGSMVMQDEN